MFNSDAFSSTLFSQRFYYDEDTGSVHPEYIDENKGFISIDNFTQQLYQLYTMVKKKKMYALNDDKRFLAVIKHLKIILDTVCNIYRIHLKRLYLVFMIPDHWAQDLDIIDLIMVPLLGRIGVEIPQDRQNRVLFITELEGILSYVQLDNKICKKLPPFFRNENRCIMFYLCSGNEATTIQSTYFQIKEEYLLRTNNGNYYTPKISAINDGLTLGNIFFEDVETKLTQLILNNILHIDNIQKEDWILEMTLIRVVVRTI